MRLGLRNPRKKERKTVIVVFMTGMRAWLLVCQIKNQKFPLGKVFVQQAVVWYNFLVNFFFGEKTNAGQTRIALRCFPNPLLILDLSTPALSRSF